MVSAADVLGGQAARKLRNQYVVIGNPEGSATENGCARRWPAMPEPPSWLPRSSPTTYRHEHISRPGWAIWAGNRLALALSAAAVFSGRLSLATATLVAISGNVRCYSWRSTSWWLLRGSGFILRVCALSA